ncbi:Acetylglutamate kinase [bacterium HR30]|nr:Acetylglutamate kinase [bacterium HR30]
MARRNATVEELVARADVLLEALPYIRRYAGSTMVIKYGGHAMTDASLRDGFAQDIVLLKYVGINPVIVHGGGPQINRVLEMLGVEPQFVRGMRVTDPQTMDVVEMVLGKITNEIVTLIQQHGGRAVGLSGKDGGLIQARKLTVTTEESGRRTKVDIGLVGEVRAINPAVIETLDRADFIPVIAPIGVGEGGESYNINADLVAGELAAALQAEKLILLTDVEGIRGPNGELLSTIDVEQAQSLIQGKVIDGGMIPKVECCLDALRRGTKKTHIIDGRLRHAVLLEIFTDAGVGTEVVLQRDAGSTIARRRPAR